MGNLKILAILALLLVVPFSQVHALDHSEFIYGFEPEKTYTWKNTVNKAFPENYGLEYEVNLIIHSVANFIADYTIQRILTGGDITTHNDNYPQNNLYEGKTVESRITFPADILHSFFVPINDEYPLYYTEINPGAELTENLFAYTISWKQVDPHDPSDEEIIYKEKLIFTKNTGLVVYKSKDYIIQNMQGEIQSHYQDIWEYKGIEALANPRILGLTIGFSFTILVVLVVLFYLWKKRRKSKL